MSESILYANDIDRQDFVETIKNHKWQTTPIVIAFTLELAFFDKFKFDNALFDKTIEGRIFSAEGEIKWRKVKEKLRVVYLGIGNPPQNLNDYTPELKDLNKEDEMTKLILWGRRYKKDGNWTNQWIEHQVPRRFTYPITDNNNKNDRVVILVENWVNKTRELKFCRYHSIEEILEGQ